LTEEWRAIEGFEGQYDVSSLGRVRALPRQIRTAYGASKHHPGGVMAPAPDRDGYPRVMFRVDGKHHTRSVHRLVAIAFHGDKRNALHREVDHIDGDRANASASNLRWVSRRENLHFAKPRETPPGAKLTASQAADIQLERGHATAKQVAERHGVSAATVYDIWYGRSWSPVSRSRPFRLQSGAKEEEMTNWPFTHIGTPFNWVMMTDRQRADLVRYMQRTPAQTASAIEAQRATTVQQGVVHESAVPAGQTPEHRSSHHPRVPDNG
jgi:hypothetical protein